MDINYINESIKKTNQKFENKGDMMPHPVHICEISFQILKDNGKRPKLED